MKKYGLLSIVLIMTTNTLVAEIDGEKVAKAATALFASGAFQYGAQKISNNEFVHNIGQTVGINPLDVGRVGTLALGLYSMSFFTEKNIKEGLRELAWKAPIAALVVGTTQTKVFQEIAQSVPVIGGCVTCDNEDCQGVCNECKLTKTILTLGIWRAVDVVIEKRWS